MARHEMHFSQYQNGHEASSDCWCEPGVAIFHNESGDTVALIQHVDYVPHMRYQVLAQRNKKPGWITRKLNEVEVKDG